MEFYEAEVDVGAPAEAVWAVLTDAAGLADWDSGITRVEGSIAPGAKFKLWTEVSPKRAFPLKVTTLDAPSTMVWAGGMPLGLFKGVRTFTLTARDGGTHVKVREEFTGPMLPLIWTSMPDLGPSFQQFVQGLKATVEAAS